MTGRERGAPGTALVTGASAGIGAELARVLAGREWDLVLTARRERRLRALADELREGYGADARVAPADLSLPGDREALHARLAADGVRVDALVNNAGFATHGPFARSDPAAELDQIEVNVAAVTHLTRLFVEGMLERGDGAILNVASTAAFQPGPLMAVYYAGKAYVLSFSEALAEELAGTGVTVTALCPGPVRTEFQERAGMEGVRLFRDALTMDAARVARIGVRGMERGRRIVVPGILNRLGAWATRLAPRWVQTKVVKLVNSKP